MLVSAQIHDFVFGKSVVLHLRKGPYRGRHITKVLEVKKKPLAWQEWNPRPQVFLHCGHVLFRRVTATALIVEKLLLSSNTYERGSSTFSS